MRSFEGAHRAISYCGGVLEFDSVTKSYGGNLVLDDLSFAVQPGQMFGFCGANGAGKTTTMRIALGLVRADRGRCVGTAGQSTWKSAAGSGTCQRNAASIPRCVPSINSATSGCCTA
ncbi:MAG: ATP-binding cassette domain-containing protein [Geodermatophilaceae bacterium]